VILLAAGPLGRMLGAMKLLVAVILIAAGAYLIYCGHRRADSIAGIAEKTGKDIADVFDGGIRRPNYIAYYAGGGALMVCGALVALRGPKA
jgi:hypothetical protein